MSRKAYTVNASVFPTTAPIPVLEPPVKTGSGKATYKTATAAANAAISARDEAKEAAENARLEGIACQNAKLLCQLYVESVHRTYRKDFIWKIAIFGLFITDMAIRIFM